MTAEFGGLRMKHVIKIIAMISVLCLVLGTLSACGSETSTEAPYEVPAEMQNVKSGVVAENSHYTMEWNKDRAAIIVTSKKDNSVWSTTPYEYLQNSTVDDFAKAELMNSSLAITIRTGEQVFEYYASTSCVNKGLYESKKIDNGISITYYFADLGIVVSADYYLEGDGFKTKVDPKKIKYIWEGNWVYKVTPAPFVCGMKNPKAGDKDNYFVVPSGSGALMYLDQRSDGVARTFTAPMYGQDYNMEQYNRDTNETPLSMPFYGMKRGDSAVCAIIESAAEACELNSRVGDSQSGYGYLNTAYQVIGQSNIFLPSTNTSRVQHRYLPEANLEPLVIGYYTLSGSKADYTGIAQRYQKYLVDKEGMKKSQDNSLLTVKLLGSYVEDDLFLGLPTTKDVALTTYDEAEEILSELNSMAGGNVMAEMYAYGDGGLNALKLAGGYKLTGVVGNKQELTDFVKFTNDASIKTYFNFDPVLFYSSGNGYSVKTDSAVSLNGITTPQFQFWPSTRVRYTKAQGGIVGALVARSLLAETTLKTVDVVDKYGITGLSYDTLGNVTYSDYTPLDGNKEIGTHPLRNNMGKDVKNIIGQVQKNSKSVLLDGAFAYGAVAADVITACPTYSDQHNSFDVDVPLYQIVFQGYRANSVPAINTAVNRREQFLKAIETGSGLSFTLMANYYSELRKQYIRGLNGALYEDNKAFIQSCIQESKSYLSKVAGATITDHQLLNAKVAKTTFSNGVSVYVNYGDTDYKSDAGTVKANGFLTK